MGGNIVLTDDNQQVLVRYEYDVFGAIRAETGTSDNTRKFTGKEFDADSNLYYYGARYYDPYIGRFTQRDPIADGVNWYAYTDNNPLARVDRNGMLWETIVDIFGGGAIVLRVCQSPRLGGQVPSLSTTLGRFSCLLFPAPSPGRIVAKVATDVAPAVLKQAFKNVKKFNLGNYRDNLKRLTHGRTGADIMKGWDAHHIIPKAVHERLEAMGSSINPNRPEFLTWWKGSPDGTHQNLAKQYEDDWLAFLGPEGTVKTDNEILEFALTIANDDRYKQYYWKERHYLKLLQEAQGVSPSQIDNN